MAQLGIKGFFVSQNGQDFIIGKAKIGRSCNIQNIQKD